MPTVHHETRKAAASGRFWGFHSGFVQVTVLRCDTFVAGLVFPDVWKERNTFTFEVWKVQEETSYR